METNEILVLAFAAGVSAFYALMVFLSSRRRRAGARPARPRGGATPTSAASQG